MGKHSAADGAVVHPIVATALQQRGQAGAPPRPLLGSGQGGSPVGWPGEPRRGERVGWPTVPVEASDVAGPDAHDDALHGDVHDGVHPDDDGSVLAALDAAAAAEPASHPEHTPVRRSGWRRLFGGGGSSTSAA